MAITLKANVSSTIEEVVSTLVQNALQQESIMIAKVNDRSGEVREGMDTLKIPRMDPLTVVSQVEGTDCAVETVTVDTDDLILNLFKTICWEIGDLADLQSKIQLVSEVVQRASLEHAADTDNEIIKEMSAGVAAGNDFDLAAGIGSDVIAKDDVLEFRKRMNEARIPQTDRWLLILPKQEKQLLAIDEFVSAEKYGSVMAIQNGELGRLFGFRVAMTTSSELAGGDVLAFHKTGLAYARQRAARFEQDRNILRQTTEYALTQLYGTKILDAGERVFRAN